MPDTGGLQKNSQERKERTEAALQAAASEMLASGEEITPTSLAQRAGCRRETIYKHPEWLDFIEKHRNGGSSKSGHDDRSAKRDPRLDLAHERIDKLENRIRGLEQENETLRSRLADPLKYSETVDELKATIKEQEGVIKQLRGTLAQKEKMLQTSYSYSKACDIASYRNTMIGLKDLK